MRYFFLAYLIVGVLIVGILGVRGDKFTRPPIRLFPDMDEQDKVMAQMPSDFFADGNGARAPLAATRPRGLLANGGTSLGGIPEYEFGGGTGYYGTGHVGNYYGNGMPDELGLKEGNVAAFLRRGEERFGIYCSRCHGESGDGEGITSRYGVPVAINANSKLAELSPETYPDGRMFETITLGKGNMGAYGHNIPLRDRWAIVAYVRALQTARKAPYEAVKEAYEQAMEDGSPGETEQSDG